MRDEPAAVRMQRSRIVALLRVCCFVGSLILVICFWGLFASFFWLDNEDFWVGAAGKSDGLLHQKVWAGNGTSRWESGESCRRVDAMILLKMRCGRHWNVTWFEMFCFQLGDPIACVVSVFIRVLIIFRSLSLDEEKNDSRQDYCRDDLC